MRPCCCAPGSLGSMGHRLGLRCSHSHWDFSLGCPNPGPGVCGAPEEGCQQLLQLPAPSKWEACVEVVRIGMGISPPWEAALCPCFCHLACVHFARLPVLHHMTQKEQPHPGCGPSPHKCMMLWGPQHHTHPPGVFTVPAFPTVLLS